MSLKVIGAGFGRTGTWSMKHALERLGFDKCYHMAEARKKPDHIEAWRRANRGEHVDWETLFQGYQAAVDWPSANFWRELLATFPDAKVVLSLRDSDDWYKSVMNTIWLHNQRYADLETSRMTPVMQMIYEVIWDGLFDRRMDDKDRIIGVFESHNQDVIDTVPEAKLLVHRASDGWPPLCEFLGCPVPAEPYPKTNSTAWFQTRMQLRT